MLKNFGFYFLTVLQLLERIRQQLTGRIQRCHIDFRKETQSLFQLYLALLAEIDILMR